MDGLIFLDTETTGNDVLKDYLFQVSYAYKGKIHSEFFKPSIPISIKSQSITHVTNRMVDDKGVFQGSQMQKDLQTLLQDTILVAHNAVFDVAMLDKEGVSVSKFICTLKVARFLDENMTIPEYNLQFLRYYFELEINANAHDAEGDVMVLEAIFQKLYDQMLETYHDHSLVIAKMVEISTQPFMFRFLQFGKYKGRKIEEVVTVDRGYLEWLLSQKMQNAFNEEDWIYTLKYYLGTK